MPALPKNFPRLSLPQVLLFGLILFCCTVDASRQISIGGVSGMGALTLAACGAVWAVWLLKPILPPGLLIVILPLMLFEIDSLGTLLWYRAGMDGVQLATVGLSFLGVLMLTARETYANPQLAGTMHRWIFYSSVVPVLIWFGLIVTHIVAGDYLNLTRPFALYAMTVVAIALSMWIANNRPVDRKARRQPFKLKSLIPLGWAVFTAYVVLLGLSRTAFIAILMLFPLSIALRGNRKSVIIAVLMLVLGAATFYGILLTNTALYNRFFHEDAHMNVGGVAFNGSGRSQLWGLLLATEGDDWLFGKGLSASEDIINRYFTNVGHPHNDYLRFYYDQGAVGVTIWLIFVGGISYRMFGNLRRSVRHQSADYPLHLAALLALVAVAFSMMTDNSICYTPVMVPLGIVMGCSLGTGAAAMKRRMDPQAVWVANQNTVGQPLAPRLIRSRLMTNQSPLSTNTFSVAPANGDAHG